MVLRAEPVRSEAHAKQKEVVAAREKKKSAARRKEEKAERGKTFNVFCRMLAIEKHQAPPLHPAGYVAKECASMVLVLMSYIPSFLPSFLAHIKDCPRNE